MTDNLEAAVPADSEAAIRRAVITKHYKATHGYDDQIYCKCGDVWPCATVKLLRLLDEANKSLIDAEDHNNGLCERIAELEAQLQERGDE